MRGTKAGARVAAVAVMLAIGAWAASAQQTTSGSEWGRGGGRRGRGQMTEEQRQQMAERRAAHQAQMMTALGLTDDQKTQFVALQQSHQEKMAALRESGQRPNRETMEAARAEYDAELAKILTAEQLAKYHQMRPEPGQRGRRGPGGGAGPGQGFGPPPAGDEGQPPPPPDGGGE